MNNLENKNSVPETQQAEEKKVTMPNDHEEKQGLFSNISHGLRKISEMINFEKDGKKTNSFQEIWANILGFFQGVDIEKGVTVRNSEDIAKIKEAFRPIIDLDETGIEFKEGDFIKYNKELGTVDFYPADKNQKTGHAENPESVVRVEVGEKPEQTAEEIEKEHPTQNIESNSVTTTAAARQLGNYLANRSPANTGNNSCGRAVYTLLTAFGMKDVSRGNGNQWHNNLSKDSRFKEIPVNSMDDIPAGAILTYSGKWKINGKNHGSYMNQKYGHVEIKTSEGKFMSYYESSNAGGSAKAPKFQRDPSKFEEWKKATGFTGAFIPLGKTKSEAEKVAKDFDSQKNTDTNALKNEGNNPESKAENSKKIESKETSGFMEKQLDTLRKKGLKKGEQAIIVSSATQTTYLVKEDGTILNSFKCSTGKNGMGNAEGSKKTSTGTLKIRDKIGDGQPELTIFKGLRPAGKATLAKTDGNNDVITTRVLTLDGMDNSNSNAWNRRVYFHGTNEEILLGKPASHGCIRLSNKDIITLHDAVKKGTMVQIV